MIKFSNAGSAARQISTVLDRELVRFSNAGQGVSQVSTVLDRKLVRFGVETGQVLVNANCPILWNNFY
jgi:hypothetical protein